MDLRFLASTGDGTWVVDEDQRIVYWNPAAEDLFGYRAEEVKDRYCHEVLCGQTTHGQPYCTSFCHSRLHVQVEQAVAPGNVVVQHHDGQKLLINLSTIIIPIHHEGEESKGIIHTSRLIGNAASSALMLRIRLFGKISVQRPNGSLIQGPLWARIKVRALLACLVLTRGKPVHRDKLIEKLWPDKPRQAALQNLNTAVYSLRRCLEPVLQPSAESHYIRYEDAHYWLDSSWFNWIDIEVFETCLQRARRESDPARAVAWYQEAVSLYQGDYLVTMNPVYDWHWSEQDRLFELYLSGLEELGHLLEKQGADETASETYWIALAADHCRERAAQGLMRLALKHGDRAAVVAHFHRLVKALHTTLDLPPEEETRRLYEVALAH
jgi:PAS domain S-box-containing protein